MRLLLVDNHDSFTHNLAHLLAELAAGPVEVVRNDDPRLCADFAEGFDAVVISPGPGTPDDPADLQRAPSVLDSSRPVLGVCLGHQLICHRFGARVVRANPPVHGIPHAIHHRGDPLFDGIASPFAAVRYHSLEATELPPALVPLAWTEDGALMAARHAVRPLYGVQFHPESACTPTGRQLLQNFLKLAAAAPAPRRPAAVPPRPIPRPPSPTPALELHVRTVRTSARADAWFTHHLSDQPHAFWLDSADGAPGSISALGDASGPHARTLTWNARSQLATIRSGGELRTAAGPLLQTLRADLDRQSRSHGRPFLFELGWVGYLGYELDGGPAPSEVPDASLIFADRALVFEHGADAVTLLCLDDRPERARAWLDQIEARLAEPLPEPRVPCPLPGAVHALRRHSPEAYLDRIRACREAIARGDSYELCLTNQLTVRTSLRPLDHYLALRATNPAPMAAFFQSPEVAICSSSPERFLRIEADRTVRSSPIKGTTARGADPVRDRALAHALQTSVKDRAENLMIVDLVRNDLGRVCEIGSVEVQTLFGIESFATVHQLVSTIRGTLRADADAADCIEACFPPGSMTGAPKIRTVQLLAALEGGPRGPYSGALGYLGRSGRADLSVLIRCQVHTPGLARIGVGGAIVQLSDPHEELSETRLKASALLAAMACDPASLEPAHSALGSAPSTSKIDAGM